MSAARFIHTTGVVKTTIELAERHGVGHIPQLRLAAWIHDAAKETEDQILLTEAQRLGCAIRPVEQLYPPLLHGAVAARLAQEEFGLDDPIVHSAAEYHTTGHPAMSLTDKVFYLADLIEPTRKFGWIEEVRLIVQEDIDQAMLFALTYQLRRLLKLGAIIDPRALELRNRLLAEGTILVPRTRT